MKQLFPNSMDSFDGYLDIGNNEHVKRPSKTTGIIFVIWCFVLQTTPASEPPSDSVRIKQVGIWTSAEELRQKPTSGPAWDAVWSAAQKDMTHASIADKSDPTNVRVLAAAIVYARTSDESFKKKVVMSVERLVAQGKPEANTLAWAREVGAYVLAADLVGYRTDKFERWLHHVAHVWKGTDHRTLRLMFETRPNNWGMHAFGSLAAIYCYLGDADNLSQIRQHWILGLEGPNPGYKYGKDLSWHVDPQKPRLINPKGATKSGILIDGVIPDDMRRGSSFQQPAQFTNYAWEVQQGLVMAARILERAGMPIWDTDDKAIFRAAYALHVRLGGPWKAKGDDRWMLAFYDNAYGTSWSVGQKVWDAGKNTGWAYVLRDKQPLLEANLTSNPSGSGNVERDEAVKP